MAVAVVGILGGPFKTTTSNTSFVFSPSTPANSPAVVLLGVASRETSTVADPSSVTGLGLTWTKIVSQHEAGDVLAASLWLGVGTPSAGTVTINFPATQTCCFAHFLELSGAPQASTIVQSLGGASTGSPLTITLSSVPTSGFVVGFVAHRANEATTPGSGFTEASDDNTATPANTGVELEWQAANDQTVDWTYVTASNATGVAVEVAAAAAAGGPDPKAPRVPVLHQLEQRFVDLRRLNPTVMDFTPAAAPSPFPPWPVPGPRPYVLTQRWVGPLGLPLYVLDVPPPPPLPRPPPPGPHALAQRWVSVLGVPAYLLDVPAPPPLPRPPPPLPYAVAQRPVPGPRLWPEVMDLTAPAAQAPPLSPLTGPRAYAAVQRWAGVLPLSPTVMDVATAPPRPFQPAPYLLVVRHQRLALLPASLLDVPPPPPLGRPFQPRPYEQAVRGFQGLVRRINPTALDVPVVVPVLVDVDWILHLVGYRWDGELLDPPEGWRWATPEGAIMRTAWVQEVEVVRWGTPVSMPDFASSTTDTTWTEELEGFRWSFGSITEER